MSTTATNGVEDFLTPIFKACGIDTTQLNTADLTNIITGLIQRHHSEIIIPKTSTVQITSVPKGLLDRFQPHSCEIIRGWVPHWVKKSPQQVQPKSHAEFDKVVLSLLQQIPTDGCTLESVAQLLGNDARMRDQGFLRRDEINSSFIRLHTGGHVRINWLRQRFGFPIPPMGYQAAISFSAALENEIWTRYCIRLYECDSFDDAVKVILDYSGWAKQPLDERMRRSRAVISNLVQKGTLC